MPTGSAIFRSGTERPVTALKFSIKKSAYLQYASRPRLATAERASASFASFFPRKRSTKRAAIYDCVTDKSIKTRYAKCWSMEK